MPEGPTAADPGCGYESCWACGGWGETDPLADATDSACCCCRTEGGAERFGCAGPEEP